MNNKEYYINLRDKYLPEKLKTIFILESPPSSGNYFYNPEGKISEPLFSTMMRCVINFQPTDKREGLRKFCEQGYFLIDATYRLVDKLSPAKKREVIIESYPELVKDLKRTINKKKVKIILVKANICRLLENRLLDDGFEVINDKKVLPYPTGWQKKFCKQVKQLLRKQE